MNNPESALPICDECGNKHYRDDDICAKCEVPPFNCNDCGEPMYCDNPLLNHCPNCGAPHNGCGQRLRDNHDTGSQLAQERGRDPGVGRPGF